MIDNCPCCGAYLIPTLEYNMTDEKSFICQENLSGKCLFYIKLYKTKILKFRLKLNEKNEYYYSNIKSNKKNCIYAGNDILDLPFKKITIKELSLNKKEFLQKINKLLIFI
jgi:hypothetical protein